ncbi:MAG: heparan-alpha-glucosaminide N-acetyltransferase domain-containing protein [Spirosomataceae bacterium]
MNRLLSLDVFRGMTVALMILVNNPGDWGHIYAPLEHATWNGCTPTDLVFPFFLFIVGVSISFSLSGKPATKDTIQKIIIRSLRLFGLGLFLALFPRFVFDTVRIPGVLQRIAVVYLICSLVFITTSTRTQWWLFIVLLVGYYIAMTYIPVPGVGAPNLAPETNLGAWIDRLILGEKHLWKSAKVWDPEGLFSTLPAIGTGISGMLTGSYLRKQGVPINERLIWVFVIGCASMVLGWAWDGAGFPINKSLWTSSYVCWTSGLAMCFLASLYWLIDLQGYQKWTKPFVVYGVNAITVFFLSGLIPRMMGLIKIQVADDEKIGLQQWLFQNGIAPLFSNPYHASLAGAITFILIWLGILWWMYNKKVFIKV